MSDFGVPARPNLAAAILTGGLVAGAVDLLAATIIYHAPLPVICKSVAGGLLGAKAAQAGGLENALIGAACHFAIMTTIAAIYVLASRRLPILVRRPLVFAPLYGAAMYGVMNYVVVPLSAIGPRPTPPLPILIEAVALHMFILAPIIVFAARKFAPARE
ncbi:hypothetical protein [Phenylobacterium sp.]|uniref:hypothetical protein n=1 Tax=Phenylobacterium sp. TaxID=1871053 RepID=UPI003BA94967